VTGKHQVQEEAKIRKVMRTRKTMNFHQKSQTKAQIPKNERDFSLVQEMKVFYPTEEEFLEPIIYIEKLFKEGVWKNGCIKIIPPSSFKTPFSFDTKSTQKMPFRSQTVQNLSRGKVSLILIILLGVPL